MSNFLSAATLVAADLPVPADLPALQDSCPCVCWRWDGRKLQFLSRAQSDWAETRWRPGAGIPD
jgi:hypothetical protein